MRLHLITAVLLVGSYAGVAAAQDTTRTDGKQQQDTITQQSTDGQMRSDSQPLSDEAVLMKMHRTNQLEVRVAQLAQRNGSSAKVKSFAATLVRDHQASDKKVTALAQQLGITLGRGMMDSSDMKGHMRRGDGRYGQRRDSTERNDTTYRQGYPRNDSTYSQSYRGDSMSRRGYEGQDTTMRQHADELRKLSTLRGAAFDAEFATAMVDGHTKAISLLEQAQSQVQHDQLRTLIANTLPTLRQHLQTAQSLSTGATTTSSSQ